MELFGYIVLRYMAFVLDSFVKTSVTSTDISRTQFTIAASGGCWYFMNIWLWCTTFVWGF